MAELERITDPDAVHEMIRRSDERPVFIFKHSLICPTSAAAFGQYESFVDAHGDAGAVFALIEIQRARPASNAVAEASGVKHESPQAILFRRGEAVWHASHRKIRQDALEQALAG